MNNIIVYPSEIKGCVPSIPSKSIAHREIIKAALAEKPTEIIIGTICDDITATLEAVSALGASVKHTENKITIIPIDKNNLPDSAEINCRSSASTLRFLIPVSAGLGIKTKFRISEELSKRPVKNFTEILNSHGAEIEYKDRIIDVRGKLKAGVFTIPGNISSQYISGLLFARQIIGNEMKINITEPIESASYIKMTEAVLNSPNKTSVSIEADWSCGAIWLCAGCKVHSLNPESLQGDRKITELINNPDITEFDIKDTPDLAPALSLYFALKNKPCRITSCHRLAIKESNRIESIISMLTEFGVSAKYEDDTIFINGGNINGGEIRTFNDHRIVMAACLLASFADSPSKIYGCDAVSKSYPDFFSHFKSAGGRIDEF